MSELWIREAAGKEKELAKLRRLLFEDQISDLEYAKAVMRLHPEYSGNALLESSGELKVTKDWIRKHQEDWWRMGRRIDEARRYIGEHGPHIEGDAVNFWNDERFTNFVMSYFGWEDLEIFEQVDGILKDIKGEYYAGHTAWFYDIPRADVLTWQPRLARSEEEFDKNFKRVLEFLEEFVGVLRQGVQ